MPEKVFDDKVALSADFSDDGTQGGERWRIKIRGYWVSKLSALLQVLDCTEKRDNITITAELLEHERARAVAEGGAGLCVGCDPAAPGRAVAESCHARW